MFARGRAWGKTVLYSVLKVNISIARNLWLYTNLPFIRFDTWLYIPLFPNQHFLIVTFHYEPTDVHSWQPETHWGEEEFIRNCDWFDSFLSKWMHYRWNNLSGSLCKDSKGIERNSKLNVYWIEGEWRGLTEWLSIRGEDGWIWRTGDGWRTICFETFRQD